MACTFHTQTGEKKTSRANLHTTQAQQKGATVAGGGGGIRAHSTMIRDVGHTAAHTTKSTKHRFSGFGSPRKYARPPVGVRGLDAWCTPQEAPEHSPGRSNTAI